MPSIEAREKDLNILTLDKWYHGTTMQHCKNILRKGVLANNNIGLELDFGYGFYLTHQRKQAEKYIKDRVEGTQMSQFKLKSISVDNTPVVIEFDFKPIEWYNKEVRFGFLPKYDNRFAEFVFNNRYHNVDGESHHDFDLIYGVMSDSIPTILIQKYRSGEMDKEEVIKDLQKGTSAKQLSIHNQDICDTLKISKIFDVNTGREL